MFQAGYAWLHDDDRLLSLTREALVRRAPPRPNMKALHLQVHDAPRQLDVLTSARQQGPAWSDKAPPCFLSLNW